MVGRFILFAASGIAAAAACNRWVDYSGGTKLVYQIVAEPGNDPADDPLIAKTLVTIIENRLDLYGAHYRIAAEGNGRIVVQFPVPMNGPHLENLRRQVEAVGKMTFVLVAPDSE